MLFEGIDDPLGVLIAQPRRPRAVTWIDFARKITRDVSRILLQLDPQQALAFRNSRWVDGSGLSDDDGGPSGQVTAVGGIYRLGQRIHPIEDVDQGRVR